MRRGGESIIARSTMSSPRPVELVVKVGLLGLLLIVCLASEYLRQVSLPWQFLNQIRTEVFATFQSSDLQWMILGCISVYLIGFVWLPRTFNQSYAGKGVLSVGMALYGSIAAVYAANYTEASKGTDALLLVFGITLFFGLRFWRVVEANRCRRFNVTGVSLGLTLLLLSIAVVWESASLQSFQYRGQTRWSGLWNNPNTFGVLMGGGVALAVGIVVQGLKFKVQSWGSSELNIEQPTPNTEHRRWNCQVWRWIKVFLFMAATVVLSIGLVKSYSRGALLGALIGISFLIYQIFRLSGFENWLRRVWIPLTLVLVSIGVLALWNFWHSEHSSTRRILSVANANDFSWRKRVAAYEGALQMIADKPWLGFGWNQPERVYDRFYRAPKVDEGMAMQMNDYLMLGTTLGIPALGCFLAYIYLSLRGREHRTSNSQHPTSNLGTHAARALGSAVPRNTSTSYPQTEIENPLNQPAAATPALPFSDEDWLRITCRAGAIVLLVGFFFDGGLFKLATGATFWILIELGSEREVQGSRLKVPSQVG